MSPEMSRDEGLHPLAQSLGPPLQPGQGPYTCAHPVSPASGRTPGTESPGQAGLLPSSETSAGASEKEAADIFREPRFVKLLRAGNYELKVTDYITGCCEVLCHRLLKIICTCAGWDRPEIIAIHAKNSLESWRNPPALGLSPRCEHRADIKVSEGTGCTVSAQIAGSTRRPTARRA